MRNFILDTGLHQLWSAKSDSTPNFVPCTGPINTTMVDTVRVAFELVGLTTNAKVRPAYRMSNDGITWSSTVTELSTSYSTSAWTYQSAAAAQSVATDQKLFVQFGFQVINVTGTQVEMGQGRLRLEITPTNGQTFVAGPMKVWSNGTNTSQLFHPMTGGIPAESIAEYRGSMQMQSNSGDARIQLAYQVSDDGITWYDDAASPTAGGFTTFGTEKASDGITYGTTFSSFSFTGDGRQLVRFGVAIQNGSNGKSECCAASLRIDIRGS